MHTKGITCQTCSFQKKSHIQQVQILLIYFTTQSSTKQRKINDLSSQKTIQIQ